LGMWIFRLLCEYANFGSHSIMINNVIC